MAADVEGSALIRFDRVSYRYPGAEQDVLAGIDLTIGRGEIVALIGPTGAGKTTFCTAINGIVPQFFGGKFFGSIRVAGADTLDTPTSTLARRIGLVFEDPESQITATTLEGEVAFALENLNVPTPEMRLRVAEALEAVGLAALARKHPSHLSGGQKQRLSIASALALAPEIIVLDEPTSQLDPVATDEVFALLRTLNRERGITVIVAGHASEELAEIAHRVVLLDHGAVVAVGTPASVFGATARLEQVHVRPPDIARSFAVLASHLGRSGEAVPVTLAAARQGLREQPLELPPAGAPARSPEHRPGARPVLEVEGLRHVYPDGTAALAGIDLAIRDGEFVGIVGRNGSGKSTLVRHFLHLLRATEGVVRVAGEDVRELHVSQLARRIGYIAQNAHQQIFSDTVAKEVGFALQMTGRKPAEVEAATHSALAAMELSWAAERHPMSLSRGDRLRVVIAAILALDPGILIFDEPTTGQDWSGSTAIMDILRRLNKAGKTIVLITHHLYLLPGTVERLVVMNAGRIIRDGSIRDVFYDPESMRAAGLLPPQTVRLAQDLPALGQWRPLGPDDLAALLGGAAGAA